MGTRTIVGTNKAVVSAAPLDGKAGMSNTEHIINRSDMGMLTFASPEAMEASVLFASSLSGPASNLLDYSLDVIKMNFKMHYEDRQWQFIPLRHNRGGNIFEPVWPAETGDTTIAFVEAKSTSENRFKVNAQFEFRDAASDDIDANNIPVRLRLMPIPSGGGKGPSPHQVTLKGPDIPPFSPPDSSVRVIRESASASTTVEATFTINRMLINGFTRQSFRFIWEYENRNGRWVSMQTVPVVVVYFIPAMPTLPWVVDRTDDPSNPWTTALDMLLGKMTGSTAAPWGVEGMSDAVEIATQVTYHTNRGIKFKYSIGSTAPTFTLRNMIFECTRFIALVRNEWDIVGNCFDTAAIVTTFANLLGADLYQTTFSGLGRVNKIKLIGFRDEDWHFPEPRDSSGNRIPIVDGFYDRSRVAAWGGFGTHEIAFDGKVEFSSNVPPNNAHTMKIYDSCLELNENVINNPISPHELLPTNLRFARFYDHTELLGTGQFTSRELTREDANRHEGYANPEGLVHGFGYREMLVTGQSLWGGGNIIEGSANVRRNIE